MRRLRLLTFLFIAIALLSSCGSEPAKEADYEQTKKMMVDILKTDEGKRALLDIVSDDELKQHLVIEADIVKETLSSTLFSEKGKTMWAQLFSDPKFVKEFHESIAKEQEKMLKHLMNDAEFQEKMLELLQNPEMQEQTIKLLKSQKFRSHLEKTIAETLNNPLYRAKLQEDFEKIISEKEKQEEEDKEENEDENTNEEEE